MNEARLPRDTPGVQVGYRGPGRRALRDAIALGWRVIPWGGALRKIRRLGFTPTQERVLVISRAGIRHPYGSRHERRAAEGRDYCTIARRDWLLTLSELRKQGL